MEKYFFMKLSLLKYTFIILAIFHSQLAFASEEPKKFVGGKVSFDLIDDGGVDDENEASFKQKVELLYEAGKYFETNYPDEKIDGDILEDVERFFPNSNSQEVFKRSEQIKSGVKLYRQGVAIYDYVKSKFISSKEPALVFDDFEYDTNDKYEYIQAPDDQVAVITDIKKVVSYSGLEKDAKAVTAKKKRDLEKKERKTNVEKLYTMFSKVEWKKFLFSDVGYSPFTGNMGMGYWYKNDKVSVRMLSDRSNVGEKNNIRFVFDFIVTPKHYIKYSSLQNNKYMQFDLSNSKNYKSKEVFYPLPSVIKFADEDFDSGYYGIFAIPFVVEIKDINEDLELEADIYVDVCDENKKCETINLKPFLMLEYGEDMSSVGDNYISNSFNHLPRSFDEKLKIEKVYPQKIDGKEFLIVELYNKYNVENLSIFVESSEDIEFYEPKILIDGIKIVAKFEVKDDRIEIVGKPFSITVGVNNFESIRGVYFANEQSLLDEFEQNLPLKLVIYSILAGFLINFMPSILPITLSRLLCFSGYGGKDIKIIRNSFLNNIFGMFSGFIVLIFLSAIFKEKIYWGMQFTSPLFLILSAFLMVFMIGIWCGFIKIENFDLFKFSKSKITNFSLGLLVVFLSTLFSSYLFSSSIGFAISSDFMKMIFIFSLIFLGLIFPYLLFVIFPYISSIFPKFVSSNKKGKLLGIYTLSSSLLWLCLIYSMQVSAWSCFRFFVYIALFLFIVHSKHIANQQIAVKISQIDIRKKLEAKFKKWASILLIIIFSISVYDGYFSFEKQAQIDDYQSFNVEKSYIQKEIKENKIVIINFDADWCLTCKYNNIFVFNNLIIQERMRSLNAVFINVDYSKDFDKSNEFISQYGRSSIPFTIMYSKQFPDGIILSKFLTETEISKFLNNMRM